jgi:APA family basic amino acid/polyamine antiporter
MIAVIATLWAYDGWNDLTMVAGEVKQVPPHNLSRALIGGLLIVGVLYMATNAAIQYILPAAQIAQSPRPAVAALRVVAGPAGAALVAGGMALSIFVTLNGTIMSGARVPFAARDRLFFPQFATIHPRYKSPSTSLLIQGLLATVLLLFLGRFQQLFELAVFAEWLFYMLNATTVFVYRRRRPDAVRPYRVWGYPLLPAVFVLCSGAVLISSFVGNLRGSLIGSGLILLGLPLYEWIRRRRFILPQAASQT